MVSLASVTSGNTVVLGFCSTCLIVKENEKICCCFATVMLIISGPVLSAQRCKREFLTSRAYAVTETGARIVYDFPLCEERRLNLTSYQGN